MLIDMKVDRLSKCALGGPASFRPWPLADFLPSNYDITGSNTGCKTGMCVPRPATPEQSVLRHPLQVRVSCLNSLQHVGCDEVCDQKCVADWEGLLIAYRMVEVRINVLRISTADVVSMFWGSRRASGISFP